MQWPTQNPGEPSPTWINPGFQIGPEVVPFLSYGNHDSGWNSDLTRLHEQESSDRHPIDLASRALAAEALMRNCLQIHPGNGQENSPRNLNARRPWVLEIGSSSGHFLKFMEQTHPEFQMVGSDFEKSIVTTLSTRFLSHPIVQMDLQRCPFPDACFDAAVALNVLEHISDDTTAIRQIYRILKPGGIAHIEVPAGPHLYDFYDGYLKHFRRYRAGELAQSFTGAGFEILRSTHLGFFVYPAFWWVKRLNRRKTQLSREEIALSVSQEIRSTRTNPILALLFQAEIFAGTMLSFPVGIRAVFTLRKPVR